MTILLLFKALFSLVLLSRKRTATQATASAASSFHLALVEPGEKMAHTKPPLNPFLLRRTEHQRRPGRRMPAPRASAGLLRRRTRGRGRGAGSSLARSAVRSVPPGVSKGREARGGEKGSSLVAGCAARALSFRSAPPRPVGSADWPLPDSRLTRSSSRQTASRGRQRIYPSAAFCGQPGGGAVSTRSALRRTLPAIWPGPHAGGP